LINLGECLTEKSGRINVGLESTLVTSAMTGYAVSFLSGSPWLGVAAASCAGAGLGLIHDIVCSFLRVNNIAVGIALLN
jgi:general nucleoside transport system permease protein